jgi:hypothetical protein
MKLSDTLLFFISTLETSRSCFAVQAGLELAVLLPQLPKCWDYRCVPLSPTSMYVSWQSFHYKRHEMKCGKKFTNEFLPLRMCLSFSNHSNTCLMTFKYMHTDLIFYNYIDLLYIYDFMPVKKISAVLNHFYTLHLFYWTWILRQKCRQ